MEKVVCVEKIRRINGKQVTMHYTLQFESGRKEVLNAKQVKELVASGRYEFLDLQIDKAGRLVKKAMDRNYVNKNSKFYILKSTGYTNFDEWNDYLAKEGRMTIPADAFLEDRKKVLRGISDKVIAEILICRAANSYKLPSQYIQSLDADDKKEVKELAERIKEYAKWLGMDPVKLAHKLLNFTNEFNIEWLDTVEEYSEPYIRDENGKILYNFTAPNVMYWSYWIKVAPKVYLCWY
ncbi:MAG: hypothetical protein IKY94_05260 [Lachnospiraceae bacterium]|nr:hypothetical protein [Lachnospiraceae bacterium]